MGIRGECDQCNYTASNPVDLASSTSLLSPTDYALLTNINPWQINQAITLGPDEAVSSLTDADPLPPPSSLPSPPFSPSFSHPIAFHTHIHNINSKKFYSGSFFDSQIRPNTHTQTLGERYTHFHNRNYALEWRRYIK